MTNLLILETGDTADFLSDLTCIFAQAKGLDPLNISHWTKSNMER